MKFLIQILCLFIPIRSLRTAIRTSFRHKTDRPKIERRFNKIADWKVEKVDGVNVASAVLANRKQIFLAHVGSVDLTPEYVAHEIFYTNEYHFSPHGNSVVIDIGMNFGYASLYFALRDDVEVIYAFEPIEEVYKKALFGFSLNECSQKIRPFNFGIGGSEKNRWVYYDKKNSGGTSMLYPDKKIGRQVEIAIKDAAVEVGNIIANHPDKRIVMKCDCEGAEQEIFERLDAKNILPSIDIVIMEYHGSLDKYIMPILDKNGFIYFKNDIKMNGMIRAINTNTKRLGVQNGSKRNQI